MRIGADRVKMSIFWGVRIEYMSLRNITCEEKEERKGGREEEEGGREGERSYLRTHNTATLINEHQLQFSMVA